MEMASILICEDERLVAKDLELALRRNGYNVIGIAGTGAQALALARERMPDLALMDIRLEGPMSGVTVAAMLAEELAIPSIFLTAYADQATVEEAKVAQPLSYLLKPFGESELRVAIETGLARHREQTRVVHALKTSLEELGRNDVIEQAVELERQFSQTERTQALLRVAGSIGERMEEGLQQIQVQLDELASEHTLDSRLRNRLQGALIHQDRAMQVAENLKRCQESPAAELEKLALEPLCREAIDEVRPHLRPGVSIVFRQPEKQLSTMADRNMLRDALVRILENANQAIEQEGIITVAFSSQYEDFPERLNPSALPGWYIALQVDDTGRGIEREHVERIFEPCFSAAKVPMNHGLGLSVVYRTVQQHQGWVDVTSVPERGTTVSLYLPCVE